MKITRAGVDRSTDFLPDELAAISVILVGWDGEVGQGTIPVPDPAGNQEPYEGEQLLIEQDTLTILDGFLGAIQSERGASATSTRRVHTMTLADDNALLSGHATAGWIRPAESAHARWAAFVADFLPGSITTTWLLTTNESGITLPAKTYRTDSLFDDLSADTIGPTGKTVYIEHRNFHWHLPTEGQTCSLVIHDTNAPTSTSFQPLTVNRSKDGMDLRNKLYARNDAGIVVSVSDATSITRHDAGGLKHEGYSEYGTESAAEMTRDLNVTLLERKAERTTWTYQIGPLTAAQAVELIPGSQMTVTTAVHGLSAAVKRIARVTLSYRHGVRSGRFMATVELGYPRRVKRKPTRSSSAADRTGGSGVAGSGGGTGGGGSDDCGCPPYCIEAGQADRFGRSESGGLGTSEFQLHEDWVAELRSADQSVAGGAAILNCPGGTSVENPVTSWINLPFTLPIELLIRFKLELGSFGAVVLPDFAGMSIWLGGSGQHSISGAKAWLEVASGVSSSGVTAHLEGSGVGLAVVDPSISHASSMLGTFMYLRVRIEERRMAIALGATAPSVYEDDDSWVGLTTFPVPALLGIGAHSYKGTILTVDSIEVVEGLPLVCDPLSSTLPTSGQEVLSEFIGIGDGSTVDFTTRVPYRKGSLRMKVDNLPEPQVIETLPSAGNLRFDGAPLTSERITADYQAA